MDAEEKDKMLLNFLKSDKIYLQGLLYAIIFSVSNLIVTLGYDLFLEDNTILIKISLFYFLAFSFLIICWITLSRYKNINKNFNNLKNKYGV